jgi:hypothetical protein
MAREAAKLERGRWRRGDRVILVGRAVVRAFGLDLEEPFVWTDEGGVEVAMIPHPSGLNRQYNDEAVRERASEFLTEALAREEGR